MESINLYTNLSSFFWSVFSRIRTEYGETSYLSVFIPNTGKYGSEKTPYLDTFHAMSMFFKLLIFQFFFMLYE